MFKKLAIGCGGLIALLIVVGIIGAVASGGGKSTPAASDKSPGAASSSAPTAKAKQQLLDVQGSGTKSTNTFTAAGDWDLTWSYDCSNFGAQGNFVVIAKTKDNNPAFRINPVNQLGAKGNDVDHYHQGGSYFLEVNSECNWHITVTG